MKPSNLKYCYIEGGKETYKRFWKKRLNKLDFLWCLLKMENAMGETFFTQALTKCKSL